MVSFDMYHMSVSVVVVVVSYRISIDKRRKKMEEGKEKQAMV